MTMREVELLVVGAGPSNLALAVALEELAPELAENTLLIERNQAIEWQPGLLLPWAKSQVAFVKDLVTLRNPRSRFSFINHLHATGRLDDFVNMGTFLPYRVEIAEYLKWVSESLSKVRLELGTECVSIEPAKDAHATITGWLVTLADGSVVSSRYLVIGTGRDPNIPAAFAGAPAHRVVHSTGYRPRVARLSKELPYRVVLVGASQSSAEMFRALRDDLPNCEITWVMRSVALTADESSKFTNELYFPSFVDEFYDSPAPAREQMLRELYKTNYSCVTPAMLEYLYCERYQDQLSGRNGKRLITMVEVTSAREVADELVLDLTDRKTGAVTELPCDLVFLGTGFAWQTPRLIRQLADRIGLDQVEVNRQYQFQLDGATAACYLQGINESTHGIADSLFSVLAIRSGEIALDLLAHRNEQAYHQPGHLSST